MRKQTIVYRNIIRCPDCGFKTLERMPSKAKVSVFHCPACEQYHYASDNQCCIFCQFGKIRCPQEQRKLIT